MRREERARLRSARDDRSKRAGRAATSGRKSVSQAVHARWPRLPAGLASMGFWRMRVAGSQLATHVGRPRVR